MEIETHVSVDEMRLQLHKASVELNRDDNVDIVMALYDKHITKKVVIFGDDVLNSCLQPFENSEYLKHEIVKFTFNFKEGGRIIRNKNINAAEKWRCCRCLQRLLL